MDELDNQVATYYDDDIVIGSVVTIQSIFYGTIISGEVTAIKRYAGMRVSHETKNYDYVVYSGLKIQIAGVKGWLVFNSPMATISNDWKILSTTTELKDKQLPNFAEIKKEEEE